MARQKNMNPESYTMSVRVNAVDLAKAGRYLVEYCGNVPTGRSSIIGAMLRMGAILWENAQRESGKSTEMDSILAHQWLEARWPKMLGGERMRQGLIKAGELSAEDMNKFYKKIDDRVSAIGEVDMMSEEELREFNDMMRAEAEKEGRVWDRGDRGQKLVKVVDEDGNSFFYDDETLDIYTAGGRKVYGMKWDRENKKMGIDPSYLGRI